MKNLSYAQIVREYQKKGFRKLDQEEAWYRSPDRLSKALKKIGMAKAETGGVADHQRRIPCGVRKDATEALISVHRKLSKAHGFDAIYDLVTKTVGGIHGIGALYIYDTSLRIAFHKGLEEHGPKEVYLVTGARDGARCVFPGMRKDPGRPRTVPVSAFPIEFRGLAAHQLHNLLCAKRKCLMELAVSR